MIRLLFLLLASSLSGQELPPIRFPAEKLAIQFPSIEASIKHWERLRFAPYTEENGSVTVGIGHSLSANRERPKLSYSRAQIDRYFAADVANATRICRIGINEFDKLPLQVRAVAINIAYQVGPTGFMQFKNFRYALSCRLYEMAAGTLKVSRWYGETNSARTHWAIDTLRGQL